MKSREREALSLLIDTQKQNQRQLNGDLASNMCKSLEHHESRLTFELELRLVA